MRFIAILASLALASSVLAQSGPRGRAIKADQAVVDTNDWQYIFSDPSVNVAWTTNVPAGFAFSTTNSYTYSNGTTQSLYDLVIRNGWTAPNGLVTADHIADSSISTNHLTAEVLSLFTPSSYINGIWPTYSSSNAVSISAGKVVANNTLFTLSTPTTHTMTSLASGADVHYIYIDYSVSATGSLTFIDSTTAPTNDVGLGGWYNGEDRCIGAAVSLDGSATIAESFGANGVTLLADPITIASSMDPTGDWQTPDDSTGSGFTPVNAVRSLAKVWADSSANGATAVAIASKEHADISTALQAASSYYRGVSAEVLSLSEDDTAGKGDDCVALGWVTLGVSKDLRIAALDACDNGSLNAQLLGWEIER